MTTLNCDLLLTRRPMLSVFLWSGPQIFLEDQLRSMSERMPVNQNELLLIEGITEFKAKKYGKSRMLKCRQIAHGQVEKHAFGP
jgi:hypothetical protein